METNTHEPSTLFLFEKYFGKCEWSQIYSGFLKRTILLQELEDIVFLFEIFLFVLNSKFIIIHGQNVH